MPEPQQPQKRTRAKKPTLVEQRLRTGALVIKTMSDEGVRYTFSDSGKAARVDVVERLIRDEIVTPFQDGLFADNAQTWGMRREQR